MVQTVGMRVVIAGGTGTLGQAIARQLESAGYSVTILTRRTKPNLPYEQLIWDGKTVDESWAKHLKDSVLINLAGELVDRPKTRKNLHLLTESRVLPTLALVKASQQFGPVHRWLQISTLAIYGDSGDAVVSDFPIAPPANVSQRNRLPQMVGVASDWEHSAAEANADSMVVLRTGVVLDSGTPALNRLVSMTKLFLGGTVGSGRQYVSWIHAKDFVAAVRFLVESPGGQTLEGVVHLTSPNPVSNKILMSSLRRLLKRPSTPPTPAFAIKIGAPLVFKTDPDLALTGRRAVPDRLIGAGFSFEYPYLDNTLEELLEESS